MADEFDVFLSYNSKDKPVVREIAVYLEECDLRPWLDEDELRPGLPWQDGLQEAIRASKAAAVCLGPHDFGKWERPEIRALLQRMVDQQLPVIPVLLPGAPEKPDLGIYLEQNTWVDLRNGLIEKELGRLVWGITGEKPKRRKAPKRPGPPTPQPPLPISGRSPQGQGRRATAA